MNDVLEILEKTGAIIRQSHFVLTSGKHTSLYINKDALYPHTQETSTVAGMFAEMFAEMEVDVVVAPALGGIILSQWVAYHLSKLKGKEVLSVYTEKTPESMQVLKRGYDILVRGKKVLVIEDLTSTGGSVMKVIKSVQEARGKIVAVGVMVNKNPTLDEKTFGLPFYALAQLPTEIYDMEECPLCAEKVPINTSVGHGKQFLEKQKNLSA